MKKEKMFKRILAMLLCVVTVFGASPAAFAVKEINSYVSTDYSYNESGDYYYIDDKVLVSDADSRFDLNDKLEICDAMYIESLRFMFDAEGKKWLVNLYEGQFGFVFVGNEVSVLVAEGEVDSFSDFTYADESEMPLIQLELIWDEGKDGTVDDITSTPYEKFRYANVMKKGFLAGFTYPNELETRVKFGFASEEMTKAFVEAVKEKSFTEVFDADYLKADTFYVDGNTVIIDWNALCDNDYYGSGKLSERELTLAPGESKTLTVKDKPLTWDQPKNNWYSSDESVATVDENGKVTAVSYGTAKIYPSGTKTCGSYCVVNVKDNSINYKMYEINEEFKKLIDEFITFLMDFNIYTYI